MNEKQLNAEQLKLLNEVAPEHTRYSCNDGDTPMMNFGSCDRCTIIVVALTGTEFDK